MGKRVISYQLIKTFDLRLLHHDNVDKDIMFIPTETLVKKTFDKIKL